MIASLILKFGNVERSLSKGVNVSKKPRLEIDIEKFRTNVRTVVSLCREKGISIAGVTKGFCAMPELAQVYQEEGCEYLADSRIDNLKRLEKLPIEKIMLRLPMLSQVDEVVKYSDISLNSELVTMKALNQAAADQKTTHGIILMIDLGDLREGYHDDKKLFEDIEIIQKQLHHLEIKGIGTNLTCFGGVIPDDHHMQRLENLADTIKETCGLELPIVSGGNSSTLSLLLEGKDLTGVTQLRLGEALLFGTEASYGHRIEGTYDDIFKIVTEVVEVKVKPTVPEGEIASNAFGEVPEFEDHGNHAKVICAIGEQDVHYEDLMPYLKNIEILGASSDHLIVDINDLDKKVKVGDEISFKVHYTGLLSLMTSAYIDKVIV